MIVKFNAVEEFIDELKKEKLVKPVVRLTYTRRANEKIAPLSSLSIVATAKAADGDIIKLEHFCGSLWGIEQEDEKTQRRAEDVHRYIENHCQDLRLEVRSGIYEEVA